MTLGAERKDVRTTSVESGLTVTDGAGRLTKIVRQLQVSGEVGCRERTWSEATLLKPNGLCDVSTAVIWRLKCET
jgi:hypothetical protein